MPYHPVPKSFFGANEISTIIDAVCRQRSRSNLPESSLQFKRCTDVFVSSHEQPLLWGIRAFGSNFDVSPIVATFFFAYSTWDGRVLFVDEWCSGGTGGLKEIYEAQKAIEPVLANVARQLHCQRVTWFHRSDPPKSLEAHTNDATLPDFLKGWLTLYWPGEAFTKYGGLTSDEISSVELSGPWFNRIKTSLELCATKEAADAVSGKRCLTVRLANIHSSEDLAHIERLVQGLADYEKEPDAVHINGNHFRTDSNLFHCLLLHDINLYVCGMAFCFIGERISDRGSPFLYLEDLYIEPEFRGRGGGQLIMRTLARIATVLGFSRVAWQALDWNVPALRFYAGIGAVVQTGLHTSRYAGFDTLEKVANHVVQ